MKVLVVHRQSAIGEKLKSHLRQWYVRTTSSGLDGLLASRMERFDLILTGFDLPVVTGIEMVRSIRNFSLNKKTRIIFLDEGEISVVHHKIISTLEAGLLTWPEVFQMKELNLP